MEFVQLSKVTNLYDGRDAYSEPLKLGKHLSITLDGALKRKTSDFNASPEAFVHAVKVLLLGYVLVSAADEGRPWCSLDAAQKHITTVENLSRISAKAGHPFHHKILEAEMNVRCEWTRIAQAETILCLSDVIEIVSQRLTIWPIATELKGMSGKGSVNKSKPTSFNPYENNDYYARQPYLFSWQGSGKD